MDLIKLELIVELTLVLCAPPLYQYYLWRRGKTTSEQIKKTAKIFAPLYLMIFAVLIAWITQ
jgi:hypothetical protein